METRGFTDWQNYEPRQDHETYMNLDSNLIVARGKVCCRICLLRFLGRMRPAMASYYFIVRMARGTQKHVQHG